MRRFKRYDVLVGIALLVSPGGYSFKYGDFVKGVAQVRPRTARKTKRSDQNDAIARYQLIVSLF